MRLFVASYVGTITTLDFALDVSRGYSLDVVASTTACSPNPSWISLDPDRNVLYCTEPGVAGPNGTLVSLSIQPDGGLGFLDSVQTPIGAAYSGLYDDNQALGVAYYTSGYIGTYNVQDPKKLETIQSMTFPPPSPGPYPVQTQPRPHEIIIDPTGNFMLVPDLGADLLRIFRISHDPPSANKVTEQQTIQLRRGSTPRHGAFVEGDETTYFYILNQNINTLMSFDVTYLHNGTLAFKELSEIDLLKGVNATSVNGSIMGSELVASPDNRYLIASLRNDSSFNIPSPVNSSTTIPSDSLLTYAIDRNSGRLELVQAVPAGGSSPRQFSLNAAGDRVAVAVQTNGWVAIFERDVESGKIGKLLAVKGGLGENGVVCVQWDERTG